MDRLQFISTPLIKSSFFIHPWFHLFGGGWVQGNVFDLKANVTSSLVLQPLLPWSKKLWLSMNEEVRGNEWSRHPDWTFTKLHSCQYLQQFVFCCDVVNMFTFDEDQRNYSDTLSHWLLLLFLSYLTSCVLQDETILSCPICLFPGLHLYHFSFPPLFLFAAETVASFKLWKLEISCVSVCIRECVCVCFAGYTCLCTFLC